MLPLTVRGSLLKHVPGILEKQHGDDVDNYSQQVSNEEGHIELNEGYTCEGE